VKHQPDNPMRCRSVSLSCKGKINHLIRLPVFSWKGDIERDGDGFIEGSIEAISAFVTELFENQSEDQIATRIPVEGDLSSPDTQTWEAFTAILKNAFIEAFNGDVEKSIELDRLELDKLEAPEGSEN